MSSSRKVYYGDYHTMEINFPIQDIELGGCATVDHTEQSSEDVSCLPASTATSSVRNCEFPRHHIICPIPSSWGSQHTTEAIHDPVIPQQSISDADWVFPTSHPTCTNSNNSAAGIAFRLALPLDSAATKPSLFNLLFIIAVDDSEAIPVPQAFSSNNTIVTELESIAECARAALSTTMEPSFSSLDTGDQVFSFSVCKQQRCLRCMDSLKLTPEHITGSFSSKPQTANPQVDPPLGPCYSPDFGSTSSLGSCATMARSVIQIDGADEDSAPGCPTSFLMDLHQDSFPPFTPTDIGHDGLSADTRKCLQSLRDDAQLFSITVTDLQMEIMQLRRKLDEILSDS